MAYDPTLDPTSDTSLMDSSGLAPDSSAAPLPTPIAVQPRQYDITVDGQTHTLNWGADRDPTPQELDEIVNSLHQQAAASQPVSNNPFAGARTSASGSFQPNSLVANTKQNVDSGNWKAIRDWVQKTWGNQGVRVNTLPHAGFARNGAGHNGPNSTHAYGDAYDVPASGLSKQVGDDIINTARQAGFTVYDERQRPQGQAVWGGSNIHIEVPRGRTVSPSGIATSLANHQFAHFVKANPQLSFEQASNAWDHQQLLKQNPYLAMEEQIDASDPLTQQAMAQERKIAQSQSYARKGIHQDSIIGDNGILANITNAVTNFAQNHIPGGNTPVGKPIVSAAAGLLNPVAWMHGLVRTALDPTETLAGMADKMGAIEDPSATPAEKSEGWSTFLSIPAAMLTGHFAAGALGRMGAAAEAASTGDVGATASIIEDSGVPASEAQSLAEQAVAKHGPDAGKLPPETYGNPYQPHTKTFGDFLNQQFFDAKREAPMNIEMMQRAQGSGGLNKAGMRQMQFLKGQASQVLNADTPPDWFVNNARLTHQEIIANALAEGKQVPQAVIDSHPGVDFNELQQAVTANKANSAASGTTAANPGGQPIGPGTIQQSGPVEGSIPNEAGRNVSQVESSQAQPTAVSAALRSDQPEAGTNQVQPAADANTGTNATSGTPVQPIDASATDTARPSPNGGIPSVSEAPKPRRIVSDEAFAKADQIIRESRGQLNMGVDPRVFGAYLVKGAYYLENGVRDFAAWSAQMVNDIGEAVKPHLKKIYSDLQRANGNPVGAKLLTSIEQAQPVIQETQALRSAAKSSQAKQMAEISSTNSGRDWASKLTAPLAGEQPKAAFEPQAAKFDVDELDQLYDAIRTSKLSDFDKVTANRGLEKLLDGKIPAESELDPLSKVFGQRLKAVVSTKGAPTPQTPGDLFTRIHRALMLSKASTLAKISSFTGQSGIFEPMSDLLASATWRPILRLLGNKNMGVSETGFKMGAEMQAAKEFVRTWGDTFKDFKNSDMGKALRGEDVSLDSTYSPTTQGSRLTAPINTILDIPGNLHYAEKAPLMNSAFGRALVKRAAVALKNGVDLSDPSEVAAIHEGAYMDSQRAILQNDNVLSDNFKAAMDAVSKNKNGGSIAKFTMDNLFPFVKVGTNVAGNVGEAMTGAVYGPMRALVTASKNALAGDGFMLTPEQAEVCLRATRRGGLGAGLVLLGYANPHALDNVPTPVLHGPLLTPIWIGAKMRQAHDQAEGMNERSMQQYINNPTGKTLGQRNPLLEGAFEGTKDWINELPFMPGVEGIGRSTENTSGLGKYLGGVGRSFEPGILEDLAKMLNDRSLNPNGGQQNYRTPKGFTDELKMGIPGLRGQVPTKQGNQSVEQTLKQLSGGV